MGRANPREHVVRTGAALPSAGVTALAAVRKACAGGAERVLVCGASGGVGQYAMLLAAETGAEVWGACRPGNFPVPGPESAGRPLLLRDWKGGQTETVRRVAASEDSPTLQVCEGLAEGAFALASLPASHPSDKVVVSMRQRPAAESPRCTIAESRVDGQPVDTASDEGDIDRRIVTVIGRARRERGISVAELARRIGIDGKRLWYVLGCQRAMRTNEFVKLCALFSSIVKTYSQFVPATPSLTKPVRACGQTWATAFCPPRATPWGRGG